jgi:hypothetical protein
VLKLISIPIIAFKITKESHASIVVIATIGLLVFDYSSKPLSQKSDISATDSLPPLPEAEPGFVWYEVPELGIAFQVDSRFAQNLIHESLDTYLGQGLFLHETNMTGEALFFVEVPPDMTEDEIREEMKSSPYYTFLDKSHKGVRFSTKNLIADVDSCGEDFYGDLGVLFAGDDLFSTKDWDGNVSNVSIVDGYTMAFSGQLRCRDVDAEKTELYSMLDLYDTRDSYIVWKSILSTIVERR